jgi:protein phosphatase
MRDTVAANDSATEPTQHDTPQQMITIPDLCMVVLIGASGSGKSTFAGRHFKPTEVLNSDHYRGVVGDDETDQSVTQAAFSALHYVAGLRLELGRLVVVDATNVKQQDRAALVRLAHEHDVLAVAIVLDIDERICTERNSARADRQLSAHVVHNHVQALRRGLRGLAREGFRHSHVLRNVDMVNTVEVVREPLWTDRRHVIGPFDIIGDVHGCYDELLQLLTGLGYQEDSEAGLRAPDSRRAIFLGDLVDRGPKIVEATRLVMQMVSAGQALCVPGNHDLKLQRYLRGHQTKISHGLAQSVEQINGLLEEDRAAWRKQYCDFVEKQVSHLVLDHGKLVVAHAGMKEAYQGRSSGRVRAFALFGDTTGETDEFGLPVRADWAADYRGHAAVVYGHTPVPEPIWLNNTINIDTGCVFGGSLTALRWPERELISVPARRVYAEPVRPLVSSPIGDSEQSPDTLLRIEDVLGKQIVLTRLMKNISIEEDRAAAALEVMSRFAADPRWLIYLPPTMSPCETSELPGWLEHPAEAFAYYRKQDVGTVVCEEKHMGSRAVLILCRDADTAARRFGIGSDGAPGVCYTRTGRPFFEPEALRRDLVSRLSSVLGVSSFWERFDTDWVCLDTELLPWSVKAEGLIREQYAPVAAAGSTAIRSALQSVEAAVQRGLELEPLAIRLHERVVDLESYASVYRRYCWETDGLQGVRIAPFHVLATEGRTYFDRDHLWHMSEAGRLADCDPLFMPTAHRQVHVQNQEECASAVEWWEALTGAGGEGIVVKPLDYISYGRHGLVQPAVKCRGRDYLRLIYGPAYLESDNLERLKKRGLSGKRALALREFALGIEALERFVRREPLWRVHQAVFAVLAMESEPVDPRL